MLKHDELELAYWGSEKLPNQWKSVDEVASIYTVTPDYILRALHGYKIPLRSPTQEIHKHVWSTLTDCFRMVNDTHFLYQTEMNRKPVDFYIMNESVGIIVDPTRPGWEMKIIHIGNSMIIRVGCLDQDDMMKRLEAQLREIGVRSKHIVETEDDDGTW